MTTRNYVGNDNYGLGFGYWLATKILPAEQMPDSPHVDAVIGAMENWSAAEIGDAIGTIIGSVCLYRNGMVNAKAASLFTDSDVIRKAVGLRRGSRQDSVRNREKRGVAFAALHETIRIASQI